MKVQGFRFSSLVLAALLLAAFNYGQGVEAAIVKITQSKAQTGSVTSGDAPGFPVTINQSGSYILDSNLTVPANTDGIVITVSNVTINLSGFTIRGSGGVTGSGIYAANVIDNITVTGGSITGMADYGIFIGGFYSRIERMTVHENGTGVYASVGAIVLRNNVSSNTYLGIHAGANSLVADNVVSMNRSEGIETGGGTIARNTIAENDGRGILMLNGFNNVLLISNTIERNGGLGIQLGLNGTGGYRDNVINSNLGGTVFGGNNMGGNLCDQRTVCP
jgi:hypothetical protein